jgi:SAM-dependent methyltransferase
MAQRTSGLRSVLSNSKVYDFSQRMLGAHRSRVELADSYIKAETGSRVLDIGCGTAEILDYLPDDVEYFGFDLSPEYVESAKERYGDRGRFLCADVSDYATGDLQGSIDVVIATGVLHHLDDAPARDLVRAAGEALRPGGRLVTIDPVFVEGQSRMAKAVISRDRGMNVRDPEGYLEAVKTYLPDAVANVRHDLLRIPYSHCIVTAVK